VLILSTGVGKLSLIRRWIKDIYADEFSDPSINVNDRLHDLALKIFEINCDGDMKVIKAVVYRPLPMTTPARNHYYSHDGAVFVFDVSSKASFVEVKEWYRLGGKGPKTVILLVGNKCDVTEEMREVSKEEASSFAEELGATYFETSAKSDSNVIEVKRNIRYTPRNMYMYLLNFTCIIYMYGLLCH
jgi:GTPase SAR1 family protein